MTTDRYRSSTTEGAPDRQGIPDATGVCDESITKVLRLAVAATSADCAILVMKDAEHHAFGVELSGLRRDEIVTRLGAVVAASGGPAVLSNLSDPLSRMRSVRCADLVTDSGSVVGALYVLAVAEGAFDRLAQSVLDDAAHLAFHTTQRKSSLFANDGTDEDERSYLLRSVLNSLFVFVGVLDLDGTLLEANDPPLKAAALSIEDVRGKPFWECYWWSFSELSRSTIRDAVLKAAKGRISRFDAQVRLAEDHFITIDFLIAPMRDASGRITHLIPSGVDITRRIAAEAQMRRTARIVEEAPFLIRSANVDGSVFFINRAGRALLGYDDQSSLKDVQVSHHHPEWALKLLKTEGYPTAAREGEWSGETAILGADGREVPTSHTVVAHRDDDGEIEYFSSIAIDISAEKQAEAALKESELRFRGTFENAAVGIAHIGLMGRWLRVNERLLEIVGYSRAELVRMTFQELTHPADLARNLELLQQLKDGQIDSYAIEKRYFRKDGTLIWVEVTVSMQEAWHGSDSYLIAFIEDITDRKLAEQRQRLLLAELNHRVKNTLAMIQSIANQTLRQSPDPSGFVRSFTGRLQSLAGAHDLLTAQTWDGADLALLLKTQVGLNGAVEPGRIKLSGPQILIPPQVALNLALVLHELANNALQHGAFASERGEVSVNWSVTVAPSADERLLALTWRETGGRPVAAPRKAGFGFVILERGLKLGLGGQYDLDWTDEGLVAHLQVPLPAAAYRKNLFET